MLINDSVTHGSRILDKFFTSRPDLFVCRTISSTVKTKHKAVIVGSADAVDSIVPPAVVENKITKRCFDIRAPYITRLQDELDNYNWNSLLNEVDVNILYRDFTKVLSYFVDCCIPTKTVNISPRAPRFITPLIKRLLSSRNRLMHRGRIDEAGLISVKVGKLIAEGRARSLSNVNTHCTRDLWRAVSTSRNRRDDRDLASLGSPFDDANAINQFFADIATDPNYDRQAVLAHIRPADHPLPAQHFSEYEVYRALNAVTRTSQGSDPFPYWLFKHCATQLTPIIAHLFNLTLATSVIPSSWKHCIVTPLPKVNPPQSLNDLRPISVTPILSRIFERLFVKLHFFPSIPTNFISDQFAFRPTGSTTACLASIFHHSTRLLADNSFVRCLLVDFSKAFDTVPHSILLDKLETYGCPRHVISWLASYLTDRTQSLSTPAGQSTPLPITRSIIQGSGIGPTSFVAYIADLHPLGPSNIYSKYADDLTILNPANSSVSISEEFDHIQHWASSNQLNINIAKTKEIVFHRSSARHYVIPPPITSIEQVDCIKLLGVYFNDNLSFCPHVNHLLTALNQRFYLLGQLRRRGLAMHGLQTVFKSIILSKILYACQSFSGFLSLSDIDRLQSCLDKAHKWGFTQSPIILTSLFQQYNNNLFKQVTQNSSHCLHHLLPPKRALHGRSLRRRGHQYELPLIKFELHKNSFINNCLFTFV